MRGRKRSTDDEYAGTAFAVLALKAEVLANEPTRGKQTECSCRKG
jgi:hypothetical protein